MPVSVHFVDVLQIIERRAGRGDDVAALVEPPVLLQLVVLAGGGNELPHAQRARRRVGQRVEGAFDNRQQGEFGRHAAFFEFIDDVVQVAPAALEDALQQIGPVQVPGLAVSYQRAVEVGHRKAVAHALPEVVGRRGEVDGGDRRQVVLYLPRRVGHLGHYGRGRQHRSDGLSRGRRELGRQLQRLLGMCGGGEQEQQRWDEAAEQWHGSGVGQPASCG